MNFNNAAIFTVPTGVGAKIGGFAGDASCWARKYSEEIPLIVNPNVVNAACFSGITQNMFYVEGWALNELVKGNLGLVPSKRNKIGVIFDKAISEGILNVHINTINAVKTVYGINIFKYITTKEEVKVTFKFDESGISTGVVENPETLLEAALELKKQGADTIAVVCLFPEPEEDEYESGDGVDIVGGVEAMISHYLTKELRIPCVHAPAFEDITISTKLIHPKASAEYITPTFLPCLFFGLENAPKLAAPIDSEITNKNIKYLITPADSLGSETVFAAINNNIEVLAVKENKTVLNVTSEKLNIEKAVQVFETYEKCLDYIKRRNNQRFFLGLS